MVPNIIKLLKENESFGQSGGAEALVKLSKQREGKCPNVE
jgi:hypothetical protein